MSTQNLDLNVNVMKARTMLGMTANATCVASSLLLEDDGFCALLTQCAHNETVDNGVSMLTEYVNNNY
jgi:hypothetical protein